MATELFKETTVAFIGAGVMGSALIRGLLHREVLSPDQIVAADINIDKGHELVEDYGIRFTTDNVAAAEAADIVVLAVKPQVLDRVLPPLRGRVDDASMILSIVASAKMRMIVGELLNSRIVRAMPNTPAQIGQGMTVWCQTHEVMDEQHKQAEALLSSLGEQLYVDDERLLDMATALSGSGPAYVFLFIEAMIDAGVRMGFTYRDATRLVLQTLKGASTYALDSGLHPAVLRNQVTSPGGTTAAGLYELEKRGFRSAIAEGVWAAYQRSVELGDSDD